jgi:hypothetical protein
MPAYGENVIGDQGKLCVKREGFASGKLAAVKGVFGDCNWLGWLHYTSVLSFPPHQLSKHLRVAPQAGVEVRFRQAGAE